MILEMILDGKLYPAEQIVVTGEKYTNAQQRAGQLLDELENTMEPATRKKLEEYLDCIVLTSSCIAEEHFKYGFALGVRLMKEAEEIPYFHKNNQSYC